MKNLFTYIFFLTAAIIICFACKKEDTITGKVAWDSYINNTTHNITIKKYKATTINTYTIKNNDTLIIQTPWDAGADTTGSMFYADSARVTFENGKTYLMKDTTSGKTNFLKRSNFVQSISPSGQTHYFRYTFTSVDYNLGK